MHPNYVYVRALQALKANVDVWIYADVEHNILNFEIIQVYSTYQGIFQCALLPLPSILSHLSSNFITLYYKVNHFKHSLV
jgi:hypothetical protein